MKTEEMSAIFFEGFLSGSDYLEYRTNNPLEFGMGVTWISKHNKYAKELENIPSPTPEHKLKAVLWEKGFTTRQLKLQ